MDKVKISPEPGQRILYLRKKIGLSRAKLEDSVGISASTLRYMETGQRKVTKLQARLLSTLFIYRFGCESYEASEEVILYGKQADDQ